MSQPDGRTGPPATPWYFRPRVVLPAVTALAILSALFTREIVAGRAGDPRLTTYNSEPQGAQLFFDLAQRLGWRPERRLEPDVAAAGAPTIHALLSTPQSLRASEAHALLERVRAGDALLLVLSDTHDTLGDSLHLGVDSRNFYGRTVEGAPACTKSNGPLIPMWPDRKAHLYGLRFTAPSSTEYTSLVSLAPELAPTRGDSTTAGAARGRRPAVVSFPYGRGRIVVASDADFLRNDVLRDCAYGLEVPAVRALEYLRDGGPSPRMTIAFDEFHQGFGRQPGTARAVVGYLAGAPSGHALFQLMAAGVVLLLALAPRAVPPRDVERVERRSPLEHVDALGRAYAQVGATRTAVADLVRGVRRRVDRRTLRRADWTDAAFLERAAQLAPARAGDVELVRAALHTKRTPEELEAVGRALQRIEATLSRM